MNMPTLNDCMVCPGFKHFKLYHKGPNNEVVPVTINYQLCNLCQCAVIKRVNNGKFVVKCTFERLKKTMAANKGMQEGEIGLWKLRFEVLKEPEKANDVITIRIARRENMKDDIIKQEEEEEAIRKHRENEPDRVLPDKEKELRKKLLGCEDDLDNYLKDVM